MKYFFSGKIASVINTLNNSNGDLIDTLIYRQPAGRVRHPLRPRQAPWRQGCDLREHQVLFGANVPRSHHPQCLRDEL